MKASAIRELLSTRLSPRSAWLETSAAVTINITGMLLEIAIGKSVPAMQNSPAFASIAIGVILMTILLLRRDHPKTSWASAIFLINATAVSLAFLLRDPFYAASAQNWFPFQGNKLGCLLAALLAPSFAVGLSAIVIHAIGPVLELNFLFPVDLREKIALGEPLATLAFALAAVLTLSSRLRRIKVEQDVVQLQAHSVAAEQTARAFLRLRDLMNTPLQVIELSVSIIREDPQQKNLELDHIERALERLATLNEMIKAYEDRLPWGPGDESFNDSRDDPKRTTT